MGRYVYRDEFAFSRLARAERDLAAARAEYAERLRFAGNVRVAHRTTGHRGTIAGWRGDFALVDWDRIAGCTSPGPKVSASQIVREHAHNGEEQADKGWRR